MFGNNAVEIERLKTENAAKVERLNRENTDLREQVAALQRQLDTVELSLYKKFFERIQINIGGLYDGKVL